MRTDSTSVFNPGHQIDGWTKIEARNGFQEQNRRPRGPEAQAKFPREVEIAESQETLRGSEEKNQNGKTSKAEGPCRVASDGEFHKCIFSRALGAEKFDQEIWHKNGGEGSGLERVSDEPCLRLGIRGQFSFHST